MSIGISIHQHDWSAVEEWFAARAKAAGHSIYEHSELFDLSSALDPEVTAAVQHMSFNLGRSISELLTKG
jgi:hypothetical protein